MTTTRGLRLIVPIAVVATSVGCGRAGGGTSEARVDSGRASAVESPARIDSAIAGPARRDTGIPTAPAPNTSSSSPSAVTSSTLAQPSQTEPPAERPGTLAGPLTLGAIAAGRLPDGTEVTLQVRCTNVVPRAVIGPPPATRNDWVVQDSTGVLYVTGSTPAACARGAIPPEGTAITLRALVATDSVARNGDRVARRYLVVRHE